MWQIWVQFLGWEDPLEKEMATHSWILAWKIPWTEEPSGLQSMGSQRVGHDWATNSFTFTLSRWHRGEVSQGSSCRDKAQLSYVMCACSVVQLYPTLCNPTDCSSPGSSVHGIFQQEYWSGLPFPPSGNLPESGVEPVSLTSPALAGRFFTTSVTWEVSCHVLLQGIFLTQGSNPCLPRLLHCWQILYPWDVGKACLPTWSRLLSGWEGFLECKATWYTREPPS